MQHWLICMIRYFVAAIGIALILCGAMFAVAYCFISKDFLESQGKSLFYQYANHGVLEFDIRSLSFFNGIVIDNLQITASDASQPAITIAQLRYEMHPFSFLFGKLNLGKITIIKPHVDLSAASGINRLAPPAAPQDQPAAKQTLRQQFKEPPKNFSLPLPLDFALAIEDLSIVKSEEQMDCSGITLSSTLSWLRTHSQFNFKIADQTIHCQVQGHSMEFAGATSLKMVNLSTLEFNLKTSQLIIDRWKLLPIATDATLLNLALKMDFDDYYENTKLNLMVHANNLSPLPAELLKNHAVLLRNLRLNIATAVDIEHLLIQNLRQDLAIDSIQVADSQAQILAEFGAKWVSEVKLSNRMKEAEISSQISLDDLLTFDCSVKFAQQFSKIDSKFLLSAPQLGGIHTLLLPLLTTVIKPEYIPTALSGSLALDVALNSSDLKILTSSPKDPLDRLKDSYLASNLAVSNFAISLPLQKILVTGLNHHTKIAIDAVNQSLSTEQTIQSLTLDQYFPQEIQKTSFSLSLAANRLRQISLRQFFLTAPSLGLLATAKAKANLGSDFQPKDLAGSLEASVDSSKVKIPASGMQSSGSAGAKLLLSLEEKNAIVSGDVLFSHFCAKLAHLEITEINGKMPLFQKIPIIAAKAPRHKNAIARVANSDLNLILDKFMLISDQTKFDREVKDLELAYASMRPANADVANIFVASIQTPQLEIRNFEIDANLKDGWFNINNSSFEIFGGKVKTDFHFAFSNKPLALRTNIEVTNIDSRRIIGQLPHAKKFVKDMGKITDPMISGNINLNCNWVANDIGGNINITHIGKEQLKILLFYIDPEAKDPTMNQLQSALEIGDLRQVSIPIKNGFLGIDVDLRLLSAPMPTPKIRGFPIAQMVANYKTQMTTDSSEAKEEDDLIYNQEDNSDAAQYAH